MWKKRFILYLNILGIVVVLLSFRCVSSFYPAPYQIDLKDEQTFVLSVFDEEYADEMIPVSYAQSELFKLEELKLQSLHNQVQKEKKNFKSEVALKFENLTEKIKRIFPQIEYKVIHKNEKNETGGSTDNETEEREEDYPQIGKVTVKTIYFNGTGFSDQNYDYKSLRSEYYDQISGELHPETIQNSTAEHKSWWLEKGLQNWSSVLKWASLVYFILAISLWCWRGWCCCCFQYQICYPDEIVWEAKRYVALNPPGVAVAAESTEIKYSPSIYEKQSYQVLYHSIQKYSA